MRRLSTPEGRQEAYGRMASSVLDTSTHYHFKKALGGSSTCPISEKGREAEENGP